MKKYYYIWTSELGHSGFTTWRNEWEFLKRVWVTGNQKRSYKEYTSLEEIPSCELNLCNNQQSLELWKLF